MSGQYIDRNLNAITLAECIEMREKLGRSFIVVREYENDSLFVRIVFDPQIRDPNIPRQDLKPFLLLVENIIAIDKDGNKLESLEYIRIRDESLCQSFRTEKEAINSYEDILVRFADCEFFPRRDEFGNEQTFLLERNNKFNPGGKDKPLPGDNVDPALMSSW